MLGISLREAQKILVAIQANGELQGLPPPAIAAIVAKARLELEK